MRNLFTLQASLNSIILTDSSELCLTAATVAQGRRGGNRINILEGGNDHDGFLRELNLCALQYPFYNHPQAEHRNCLSIIVQLEFKSRPVIVSGGWCEKERNSIPRFYFLFFIQILHSFGFDDNFQPFADKAAYQS